MRRILAKLEDIVRQLTRKRRRRQRGNATKTTGKKCRKIFFKGKGSENFLNSVSMPLLNLKDGDWYHHFLKSVTILKKPYHAMWHFAIITVVTSLCWSNFLSTQSDACLCQQSSSYTWQVGNHTRTGHSKFKILGAKF